MPLLEYHGVTSPVVTITNDTGQEGAGDTSWDFVDNEMLTGLPAELTDPLLSLNAALQGLHEICGATGMNIALSVLTASAWGNTRAVLAVPEFIKWVETGESSLSGRKGFETPLSWPVGWVVKLEVTDGYSMGMLQAPRFTLTITKGNSASAAATRLSAVPETSH